VGAVLLLAYFGAAGAAGEPDYWLARLLSYLPPTAPVVMPARMAAGGASAWEVVLAVLLVALGIVALVRVAGHVYPRVALHSGARLKLRQAWARPVG
jgi:ABC-2 type transport system permease protein